MMFLSYSTKDHHFAELASLKLAEAGIMLWRDQRQLRGGADWRQSIEEGISGCVGILVALSSNSAQSSYVTYEWAYALGKGKPVIPLRLNECPIHPRLETIQYLDFAVPGALPWESLIERIREIETDKDVVGSDEAMTSAIEPEHTARAILAYLNQRGYQMVSFDRVRRRINEKLDDNYLRELVDKNPTLFRYATLKENKPGLAKVVP